MWDEYITTKNQYVIGVNLSRATASLDDWKIGHKDACIKLNDIHLRFCNMHTPAA